MRRGGGYNSVQPEGENPMCARVQLPLKMLPGGSRAVLLKINRARELEWRVKISHQECRLLQIISGLSPENDVERKLPESRG